MVLWSLTVLEWLAGHWSHALEHAGAAYELTEQTQHAHARHWVGRAKALLEADLGLVEQARASADEVLALAQDVAYEIFAIETIGVLGRLELAARRSGIRRGPPARPPRTPPRRRNPRSGASCLGGLDRDARRPRRGRACARLPRAVRSARRPPGKPVRPSRRRPLSRAGLAAEGDLAGARRHSRVVGRCGAFPLERGRTLLCLGVVRRQAQKKRSAREALDEALAIFEGLGAQFWAEKARAELKRISGRARRPMI